MPDARLARTRATLPDGYQYLAGLEDDPRPALDLDDLPHDLSRTIRATVAEAEAEAEPGYGSGV